MLPLFLVVVSMACQETTTRTRILNTDPQLKKTDFGWFYQEKPFSGYMIEAEKDHRVVYSLPIIAGQEQGVAKGWYNTGERLLERNFIDGKKEGTFTQWWPNGKIRYLFHYKNNLFNGAQFVFFPDGKKREESHFQAGEREGIQRVWNENGRLVSNYTIKDKKLYGVISVKSCIPVGH